MTRLLAFFLFLALLHQGQALSQECDSESGTCDNPATTTHEEDLEDDEGDDGVDPETKMSLLQTEFQTALRRLNTSEVFKSLASKASHNLSQALNATLNDTSNPASRALLNKRKSSGVDVSYTYSLDESVVLATIKLVKSYKMQLVAKASVGFTVNTDDCTLGGSFDAGSVYLQIRRRRQVKIDLFDSGITVDATTSRIKFDSDCATVSSMKGCAYLRFVNQGGCDFDEWDIEGKATLSYGGYTSGTGWVTIASGLSLW